MGLAALFGAARRTHVVGTATSGDDAVIAVHDHQPDVVLMDADLAENASISATQRIHDETPYVRVVMFGSVADAQLAVAAIHAGACGYILKHIDPGRLVDAVENVAAGGFVFDEAITEAVMQWLRGTDPLDALSDQERRILELMSHGRTNRQIAAALDLSEYTVKTYVSAILRKLGLTSRSEAAAYLVRRQYGRPD
jgi:two-component system response regulator DevR